MKWPLLGDFGWPPGADRRVPHAVSQQTLDFVCRHPRRLYETLFATVAATLTEFAHSERHLGGSPFHSLGIMSIFDAVAYTIGETAAYVVGRIVGKTFHLDPKQAKNIGDNIVICTVLGAAVIVTFVYS